jgi:lipopolysaccharide export system protein LptA
VIHVLLLIFLSVTAPPAAGDEGFVVSADSVEGREEPGGRVVELQGNVRIERSGAVLTGRSGVIYEEDGLAVLTGDVRGTDGAASISGDTLRYYRDDDIAVLVGNVSFADTSVVVSSRRAEIYRMDDVAIFSGDVRARRRRRGGALVAAARLRRGPS